MFYYLFEGMTFPGAGLFHYVTFRSALAFVGALLFVIIFGKKMIEYLQLRQIGETIRDLNLEGQMSKKGTPTMGGVIIIGGIIIPCLLFGNLSNIYMLLMLAITLWLGFLGGMDDYIKVFKRIKTECLHA